MDSPKSSHSAGDKSRESGRRTPINQNNNHVYWSRFSDCGLASPERYGFTDVDEIGWGDSPEPLKIEYDFIAKPPKQIAPNETPPSYRKKKTARPSRVATLGLAAEQDLEIIKKLTQKFLGNKANEVPVNKLQSSAIASTSTVTNPSLTDLRDNSFHSNSSVHSNSCATNDTVPVMTQDNSSKLSNEPAISDLKKLLEDDDDVWLSQVDLGEACHTPHRGKNSLVKSRSENQLDSPSPNRSGSFRRSFSFQPSVEQAAPSLSNASSDRLAGTQPQPLKKQKSFHVECLPGQKQCTAEQIEQKRLQAIYRREYREIERRKLEAQKRLNERRARLASAATKR